MKKRILVLPLLCLSACNGSAFYNYHSFYFDTFISVSLLKNKEDIYQKINETLNKYHQLFDNYQSYNNLTNIYDINQDNEIHTVNQELFEALKTALFYKENTNGYFELFIGSLKEGYEQAFDENRLLSDIEINNHLIDIQNSSLILNEENLQVQRIGKAKIDLGAFAKGYALEMIKNYLDEQQFLINAGSSSILLGNKNGKPFKVGLRYDQKHYFKLANTALGVSSYFERGYTLNDVKYSHIINPFNGDIIPKYDYSIVIDDSPLEADIYSTVTSLMDIEDIKELDKKVVIISSQEIIYKSDDINIYFS